MTEKRFKNVGKDILQYSEWWCSAGGEHCADVIATAMNELIKENEQLKQDIGELQNDKLLTVLQMKCDKKQEHIVTLENKIRRMREAIHKLEWFI